jgi:tripartite-type tricarboxylate transporter receptor subunit TctC
VAQKSEIEGCLKMKLLVAALFGALLAAPVLAQGFPDKPVKLVVPYPPGGQFDIHARILADKASPLLGQRIVIENKPGAATMLGAEYVAQQKPDGYTVLWAGANMFTIAPHVYKQVRYKTSDFQTITLVNDLPMGFEVNTAKLGVRDFNEFVAYAKANPGKISYGTSGTGGLQHLMCELIKMRLGLDMFHIAYKGTPEVLQDLKSGEVQAVCDGMTAYLGSHREANSAVRILAQTASARAEAAADVPTFRELGYPDLTFGTWGGIVAPAGTPADALEKLRKALVAANEDPEVKAQVAKGAAIPRTSTAAEFDAIIKADYERWGAVVRRLGLTLD